MKKMFLVCLLLLLFLIPIAVHAQFTSDLGGQMTTGIKNAGGPTGLTPDLTPTMTTIINGVLSLVGTIFLILIIYAGILWMTASGNEEQVTKAKNIATQSIIGLVITLSAYAITGFVTNKLTSYSTGSGSGASCGTSGAGVCVPKANADACDQTKSKETVDPSCPSDEICCGPK